MRRITICTGACLCGLALGSPAAAQGGGNLLVNGNFAMGLTGYTAAASPGYLVFANNECAIFGTCAQFGTPGTGTGGASLSQEIATTPGARYVASLATGIKPLGGGFFVFLAAAGQQVSVDCTSADVCDLTLPFTATGLTTAVTLGVQGYVPSGAPPLFPSGTSVSRARVVQAVVPEPAPLALLGGALAVLGGCLVVRRRAAST